MTKQFIIISLMVVAMLCATTATVDGREFRSANQKVERSKKADKNANKSSSSSVTVAPLNCGTTKSVYAALLSEQALLSDQIGVLSAQLQGASKGNAKKLSKQINDLTASLATVERRIETFPESIKNPASTPIIEVDEEFNEQFNALAAKLIAASDPYEGQISTDPQLESLYRDYLRENGGLQTKMSADGKVIQSTDGLVYRVMIAISKNELPKSSFNGLNDILEQRMDNGGVIYYQGSYENKADADRACGAILSQHKFRDAFVVAMNGDRRVPVR